MSSIYPLQKTGETKTYLHPSSSFMTEEAVRERYDLWLKDSLEKDEHGIMYHRYRLCADKPHNIEMALAYDIKCPKCGNKMKQVGRMLNSHELGEYACKSCDDSRRRMR